MYEKFEKYTVNNVPGIGYEVWGQWKDDIHDIRSRLVFDFHSYKVLEADAQAVSIPFDICQQGIDNIKYIVGEFAGPGFNKKVRQYLMGSNGCIHLAELVGNSLKSVLQAASRETPEWVDEEEYNKRWGVWEALFKDTCIYFSQPDALKNLQHKVQNDFKDRLNEAE